MIKTCKKFRTRANGVLGAYKKKANPFWRMADRGVIRECQVRRAFNDIRKRIEEERKRRLMIMEEALPIETSDSKVEMSKIRYREDQEYWNYRPY